LTSFNVCVRLSLRKETRVRECSAMALDQAAFGAPGALAPSRQRVAPDNRGFTHKRRDRVCDGHVRREGRSRTSGRTILGAVKIPKLRQPGVRISDSDRERAAERLNQALAEGRITVAELEERLAAVYAARYTVELRPPLADLPGDDVLAVPPAPEPLVLRAGAGGIKRIGEWSVPARMRVESRRGSVVLDFCETAIAHPVVEIELVLGKGSADLLVPDDATANVDALVADRGSIGSTVASQRRAGAPHFVVRGRTRRGSVTVRRRRGIGRLRF
jgi:hypothetical protein